MKEYRLTSSAVPDESDPIRGNTRPHELLQILLNKVNVVLFSGLAELHRHIRSNLITA